MSDINVIVLTGRLGREPELKYTQGGFAILSFSLACSRYVKDKPEATDWIDCKCIGKRAEGLSKILTKGDKITVEGRLQQETWEKEGQKRSKHVVIVNEVSLPGGKRGEGGGQRERASEPDPDGYSGGGATNDDDIPFARIGDVG